MKACTPLVTIGIPTYNRAELLRRSIESALCQDYAMIEVIISDNASTDNTRAVCQAFCHKNDAVKYIAQSSNIGASANFADVLKRATGKYFMWLGDDDWIDTSYISHCVSLLETYPDLSLVSGTPIYYQNGIKSYVGKVFDLLENSWAIRVAHYYAAVADNGMFYGLMRTVQLQQLTAPNVMGGDWHLLANIVSIGKTRMSTVVSVHRELGGATTSYQQIVKSLGLPAIQAIFPMTTIALSAFDNIVFKGTTYKKRHILIRIIVAGTVFLLVIAKPSLGYVRGAKRLFKRSILFFAK
ncbi:MAG: glycosyltransferase family 2 protein [Methylococcales bacterium]|nr:glycosyltransferase family 2 protein [Methylococcales bacterium]